MSYVTATEINAVIQDFKERADQSFNKLPQRDQQLIKGDSDLYEESYKSIHMIRTMARELARLRKEKALG